MYKISFTSLRLGHDCTRYSQQDERDGREPIHTFSPLLVDGVHSHREHRGVYPCRHSDQYRIDASGSLEALTPREGL